MIDSPQPPEDDLALRAERAVASVMARIAAAPLPRSHRWIDLQYLAVPALAASLLIAAAAAMLLAKRSNQLAAPRTIADAVGLPAPIAEWIDTGALSPWALVGNLKGDR
ncbi:MAG: hypothetical protein ABI647_09065 [Gemmatimonadota bacterium]